MLVLRSARRPDLSSMLPIEKSKTIFNQKNNCAWLGIIQIQRSFNLQLFNGKTFEPIFFTSYNEFCSRQRRTKGSRAGRALDGVPTVANRMI